MATSTENFVNVQWLRNLAQETRHIKHRSYELMKIQSNSQILDVGCGPGVDTIPLSEYIDEQGRIVGVDYDPLMIEVANQELAKIKTPKRIQHIQGNISSLPFHNQEFDIIHLERFFQVFPRAAIDQIFAELNRVLKSNGRIVLVDMDMATLSVNFSDNELERKIINYFGLKLRPNGFVGRQLAEILKKNNYKEISVEFMTHLFGNLTREYFLNWIISGVLDAKIIAPDEAVSWNQELREKVDDGTFLAHITNVLVSGIKP